MAPRGGRAGGREDGLSDRERRREGGRAGGREGGQLGGHRGRAGYGLVPPSCPSEHVPRPTATERLRGGREQSFAVAAGQDGGREGGRGGGRGGGREGGGAPSAWLAPAVVGAEHRKAG
ncbi:hypothetical protein Naga_102642g1 [Nannochloropsis gaditana]|uniref:Uncharacterized protein n=1 Tax=Nannochloropsis gaditana TaxID=72520 RepID=W7TEM0_9STRA|nr:hypothetical protein Naga_102642g1 [Nannochloropsis gaditana]